MVHRTLRTSPAPRPIVRRGFTILEVLVTAIVFGVLASLVVPQFASASTEATKSDLTRTLLSVEAAIADYRDEHEDRLPTADPAMPMKANGSLHGWGVLVADGYLASPPRNAYTDSSLLAAGGSAAALAATSDDPYGWFYDIAGGDLFIFAAGYDRATDRLTHERVGR
jgi:prepilin-type N-terminal cleavage/methylation domain-containing protein